MALRTLSVRVEVQVEAHDQEDLHDIRARLTEAARAAVADDRATRWLITAGTVTRRPGPNEGPL